MLAELGFVFFVALVGLGLIRHYHSRAWSFVRLTLLVFAGISALASAAICINQEGPWENVASNNSGGGRGAVLGLVVIAFSKLGPIFTGLILLAFAYISCARPICDGPNSRRPGPRTPAESF